MEKILGRFSLFGKLNSEGLAKLGSIAAEARFAPGETIVEEGKQNDFIYIVNTGKVRVTKGRELDLTLGEGSLIGELSFIDKGLPSASVKAAEAASLIKIPFSDFEALMAGDKELAYSIHGAFLVGLCKKLRNTNEWLLKKGWPGEVKEQSRILYVI